MEEKKQIENEHLTKVYHTNHIVEAITVEKRCTGIARYRKVSRQGYVNLETGEYIESKARASPTLECTGFMSMERWNFMLKYISELSEIQNEVLEDFERYKRTSKK